MSNTNKRDKDPAKTEIKDHQNYSKIISQLLDYISVNGFKLSCKRLLLNFLLRQIENDLDVIVIPISFFKFDKQLLIWILQTPNETLQKYLRYALEELSGEKLSNRKIEVLKNQ